VLLDVIHALLDLLSQLLGLRFELVAACSQELLGHFESCWKLLLLLLLLLLPTPPQTHPRPPRPVRGQQL
jgi:hypothetical protein